MQDFDSIRPFTNEEVETEVNFLIQDHLFHSELAKINLMLDYIVGFNRI